MDSPGALPTRSDRICSSEALEIINRKYPDTTVVFAGEDHVNYESTWRKHRALVESYKSQLIFLGLIRDRQELANYYAACDILVMPSNNECFGLTQVESMLCGTPVVMTDIYGGRVPILVTGMGKLAKSGDWRSIGETAVDLLGQSRAVHQIKRIHSRLLFI